MFEEEIKIHGSFFFLLKRFMDDHVSYGTWEKLVQNMDSSETTFEIHETYPIQLFNSLVSAAADLSNITANELEEKFGESMVPDLLVLYAAYLKPHWKTFELLENTESVMHEAVRKLYSTANPPKLHISRVDDNLLIIDYHSKRKMASLAIGIIKGIASFYGEKDKVAVIPTTDLEDDRVQIRVEFF